MKHCIKHLSLVVTMFLSATFASAQSKILESVGYNPDTLAHYYIFTGDTTYERLPNEMGEVKPHRNKVSKLSRLVKKAASVASTGALVGGVAGGLAGNSLGAITTAGGVLSTAGTVSTASDIANSLAGIEGKDIAFKGKKSTYKVKNTKGGIRILAEINTSEDNPMEIFRVVRFFEVDKDRRVQWGNYKPALIGDKDSFEHGFLGFTGEKCGKNRFILNIPENQLKSGEYGIFFMDIVSALAIPVGTFSVK